MRKIIFIFIILFLFPLVSAACSLGANPLSMEARVVPGQTVTAEWNLYNLYGDKATHVKVSKSQGPDWKISFEPELKEVSYEVSGVIEKIKENIALEPENIVSIKPEIIPEGIDYVKHPKQEGYILVKPVKINIEVPETAEIGKDYNFVFEAQGSCFMGPGAVLPGVATQLELNIKTITDYYEKKISEEEEKERITGEGKEEKKPTKITGAVIGTNLSIGILMVISFVLIIVILSLVSRMKKQSKK